MSDFARGLERELAAMRKSLHKSLQLTGQLSLKYRKATEAPNSFAMAIVRESVSQQRLSDALVQAGVIHSHAIEDKEGYDNYRTWDRLKKASNILANTEISRREGENHE